MQNNDKIISIKRIKLSIMRDFKRNSEQNNKRNLEHSFHKPTGMPLTEIHSSVDYLWPLLLPMLCNLLVEIVNG